MKSTFKHNLLLWILPFAFIILSAGSPKGKSKGKSIPTPKLVVGIVVDQMRYDYLFKYWDKYGDKGFKRLVNEGYLSREAHYNYMPTYTGPGHASIFTGTTPAVHGIISNEWFDRGENEEIYCVSDHAYETVGASGKAGRMSPTNLRSATIGDELRLWSNMKSKVIGISLKDRAAILPAGRAANAAYWYDATSGCFITSTYYMKALPEWLTKFNGEKHADNYLSKEWNTLLPIADYTESGADNSNYENPYKGEKSPVFPHNLPALKANDAEIIRKTPFGNSLLKDMALATIKAEELGKNEFPDFLSVSFSSTDYVGHQFGPASIELEDTYIRLDKEIAELLSYLDSYLGKGNVLVFLTADHGATYSANQLDSSKLANGITDFPGIQTELEKLLDDKYGKKEKPWVSSLSNYQVFFNYAQLDQNKITLAEITTTSVAFIEKHRGISRCYTSADMRNTQWDGVPSLLQRGYHPKRSGDILILNEPLYGELLKKGGMHSTPYPYDTHVPVLFWGGMVKHGESSKYITITDIAPTVSSLLNIEAPNGCTGKIIEGVRK